MTFQNITRRGLLKTGAIFGADLAVPTIFTSSAAQAFTNDPTGKTVTFGFTVPQSGPDADEGADELRAFQLAVKHLNGEGDGGMLSTFSSKVLGGKVLGGKILDGKVLDGKVLDGKGLMGSKIVDVSGDTQTKTDAARALAKSMIEKDGAIMISGGSSSGEAIGLQALCQDAGLIYMCGLTHSNDTTGKDKKRNGFRLFFNAALSARARAPVLKTDYGTDRKAYHLTADYTWGWTQQASMQAATEGIGWQTTANVLTPLENTDFSSCIAPVLNSGADVLILNHYGANMVNSLTQAVQFGLRDKMANGKQFAIVVPLISELMAKGAGANIKGIPGSSNWNWKLQDEGTKAFVKSYGTEYGMPPSQAVQVCHAQTLLYADTVARAKSFNPCAVVEALEGYTFDGPGNGPTV